MAVVAGTLDDYLRERPARPVPDRGGLRIEARLRPPAQGQALRAGRSGQTTGCVNLIDRVLEVYREPVPTQTRPFGWRYARREVLDPSMRVAPLAAPSAAIRVADLLPSASRNPGARLERGRIR